jgi:hypothetical protein
MSARQDEAMVVHTLAFMVVRQVLCLVGPGPSPDARDVEIAASLVATVPRSHVPQIYR